MNSGRRSSVKRSSDKRKVAVVGSGVAGLTAAWVLSKDSDVTLYEADSRLGGHADTHAVTDPEGRNFAVDTGFIVHNDRTYPTLLRLFAELGVVTQESDMSMSVRCEGCGLEYSGGQGLRGVLPTPGLLVNGSFLSMLMEVKRFHRRARALLEQPEDSTASTASTASMLSGASVICGTAGASNASLAASFAGSRNSGAGAVATDADADATGRLLKSKASKSSAGASCGGSCGTGST